MPIFSYICNDCGEKFDLLVGVTVQQEELKCTKCKSQNIKKTIGTFSLGGSNEKSYDSDASCPSETCPLG